jgi:ABC-type proline/glycine betaine transport system permease subunit
MSATAKKSLEDAASATGMTMTQVLEVCVAKYALELPNISEGLKAELLKLASKHLLQDHR